MSGSLKRGGDVALRGTGIQLVVRTGGLKKALLKKQFYLTPKEIACGNETIFCGYLCLKLKSAEDDEFRIFGLVLKPKITLKRHISR